MEKLRFSALCFILVHHIYTFVNLSKVWSVLIDDPNIIKKLAPFKNLGGRYLTNWNFFNQLVYVIIELLVIVIPLIFGVKDNTYFIKAKKLSQLLFWSIIFPWTCFIPSIFWPVYNYDRELIFPKIIDKIMPLWINHSVHTVILLLIFVELGLNKERPPRWQPVIKNLTIYALFYTSVMVFTYFNNKLWLYGFLYLVNWPQRIGFFLVVYFLLTVGTRIGLDYKNNKYINFNKVKH